MGCKLRSLSSIFSKELSIAKLAMSVKMSGKL